MIKTVQEYFKELDRRMAEPTQLLKNAIDKLAQDGWTVTEISVHKAWAPLLANSKLPLVFQGYQDIEIAVITSTKKHSPHITNITSIRLGSPTAQSCWHDWKAYLGFNEKYNYCTKCDAKEFPK